MIEFARLRAIDANGDLACSTHRGPGEPRSQSATFDLRDRKRTQGGNTYAYNENGELTTKTDAAQGNRTTYSYSAAGDLTGATLPSGKQITYILDGLGRRVAKQVDGEITQGFIYAPGIRGPVAETDADGDVIATFIYATRTNVPDLVKRGGNTYRVISDQLGSQRMVVNSSTGEVAPEVTFDVRQFFGW